MAAKPGAATPTYSPKIVGRSRLPIFKDSDLDWSRPDGRGFHQCRPACKNTFDSSKFLIVRVLHCEITVGFIWLQLFVRLN